MSWNQKAWLRSSAAAPRTPQKWRWVGSWGRDCKSGPRKSQQLNSDQRAWWGCAVQHGRLVPDLSPHHLPFTGATLRPSKAAAQTIPCPARPLLSRIFQFGMDGVTANASVRTEKRICECAHCILYTQVHTLCIGCQFIPDLLGQLPFSHIWAPQTIETS